MRLLIDIGNTRIKYLLEQNRNSITANNLVNIDYLSFPSLLASDVFSDVSEVIVANVQGNELINVIEAWALQGEISFIQVYSQSKAFGVSSCYEQPEHLGVDRWLALIAAHQLYPRENVLIIDAGTAITVDLLAKNGEHIGGWIMPGVQTMFDSLLGNTQKIFAEQQDISILTFGENSSECVNLGIWAMVSGAINNAIAQANETLTLDKVIVTGGNSEQIAKIMSANAEIIPELLFHGLSCFHAS